MSGARIRIVAALLALLMVGGVAIGVRCLSVTEARCSLAMLFSEQPRLDVPYAETRAAVIARMLEMADVNADDYVIDLGTGDGRILIAAARDRGALGLGVDIDPILVREARANARDAGVAERVRFRIQDLFETPLGQADVLTMYLLPEVNLRLRPRILAELAPGSHVVSHFFDMGEWRPDATTRVGGSRIHLWIVPARIEGRWRLVDEDGVSEVSIHQRFQYFGGVMRRVSQERRVSRGVLRGDNIRFVVQTDGGPRTYEGAVRGDRMISTTGWRAARLD